MIHIDPDVMQIEPEILGAEAANIEAVREQFTHDLEARQAALEGLGWDKESRHDIVGLFDDVRFQMRDVDNALGNIAQVLRTVQVVVVAQLTRDPHASGRAGRIPGDEPCVSVGAAEVPPQAAVDPVVSLE